MVDIQNNICIECERIEEDSIHSAKGHYNAASLWSKIHYGIGIPMTIAAAWAGIDAFSQEPNLAGYLALSSAALAALQTFLGSIDKATQHKSSADEYLKLRDQTRLFREIRLDRMDIEESQEKILQLAEKKYELNRISPSIPYCSFKKAKKGIDAGQTNYLADKGER